MVLGGGDEGVEHVSPEGDGDVRLRDDAFVVEGGEVEDAVEGVLLPVEAV